MSSDDFQLVSHSKRRKTRDEVDESNIITEKRQRIASAKVREGGETLQSRNHAPRSSVNHFEILSNAEDNFVEALSDAPTSVSNVDEDSDSCNSCFEDQESSSNDNSKVCNEFITKIYYNY